MQKLKILLVQLGSNGDCLFATIIAKQIKEFDYQNSYLTWMIGSKYKNAIINNPYIDEIIEIPINSIFDLISERDTIDKTINRIKFNYDHIFITDHCKSNLNNWYGTTRSSILRSYPHKIKVKIEANIFLTDDEQKNVKNFCNRNEINSNFFNLLIEASPQSGQSNMNLSKALILTKKIVRSNPRIKCIISSPSKISQNSHSIVDASSLTWRENAELANYCDLLVGCSSGISWLCLSNWTKPINMIQVIKPSYANGKVSASVKHDLMFYGLPTDNIIELYSPKNKKIIDCIFSVYNNGFINSKIKYDSSYFYTFKNKLFLDSANITSHDRIIIKNINSSFSFTDIKFSVINFIGKVIIDRIYKIKEKNIFFNYLWKLAKKIKIILSFQK